MISESRRKQQTLFNASLFAGFLTAGLLLSDFRSVTSENFAEKMEELVRQISLVTQNKQTPDEPTKAVPKQSTGAPPSKSMFDEE